MKLRKIIAVCMALMIALGSFTCVFADETVTDYSICLNVEVVDKDGNPAEGIIMRLGCGEEYEPIFRTTDATGREMYNIPPGKYELMEMGYKNNGYVYNDLWFEVTKQAEIVVYDGNAEYKIKNYTTIVWTRYDYEHTYIIRVELDDDQFSGSKVELVNSDGSVVKAWNLREKGELVADLAPGSYTLREIVEINGYEMPVNSNIMVGCGKIVPFDPEAPVVEPSVPDLPDLPDYVYDEFQKWLNQL